MRVAEIMLPDIALLDPGETVVSAARGMADSDTSFVLVGAEDRLDGVLTERDILIRVVAAGLPPGETQIGQVMSSSVFTCSENDAAEAAEAQMAEHRVRQLPVLDGAGRLVGTVTREAAQQAGGEASGP
ncbi:MAG: CBS domain-containing protein [Alphaproteobacteria bacterium]|nr:CBS domain-containing protein [Alphaproteobacteria bacterium]